eukprot:25786-Eustigmatos_ZCMA.PRE.1
METMSYGQQCVPAVTVVPLLPPQPTSITPVLDIALGNHLHRRVHSKSLSERRRTAPAPGTLQGPIA